jgi:predicted amidohydrolase
MRLSLLQPEIIRGNIEHNLGVVQKLINQSRGQLLVLPEYALTGSLVLDKTANVGEWAIKSAQAKNQLIIPNGKVVLINTLVEVDGSLYNCCDLLPGGERYCKLFPDKTELEAGIHPGGEQKVFELCGKRFKVLVCYDLPHIQEIPTDQLDFLLFIYHFTGDNFPRIIEEVKQVSKARRLPVFAASLVSDQNNGSSSFVDGDVVISLSTQEGILEAEIADLP